MQKLKDIKVAIIDLNNGKPNQALPSIYSILEDFQLQHDVIFYTQSFALRNKGEIPDLGFDIYISTGGPGSPYDGNGHKWEEDLFNLLDALDEHNLQASQKKFTFLICHSFQLACMKYKLGTLTRREKIAAGVFPVYLTPEGENEPIFKGLKPVFYSIDNRNWQVVNPNAENLKNKKAVILAIENPHPNPDQERCLMAIRFSREMIGTQFHPEANPIGVKLFLHKPEIKKLIEENYSAKVYSEMIENLNHPERIPHTFETILPNFLMNAVQQLA
ncbi:glutamine amidotransferase-related protein [Pedobacter flavus]|uniref:GMP synthase n=1 Tax=Pedobacter flavus TaxID=3113906 RepID=A0ABU7H0P7_9SPHI|nr:GMP synthase [Pedobacter sp. VNH31]MEE1884657.1 GMP synthase [Pedobacter sp. VNH31]